MTQMTQKILNNKVPHFYDLFSIKLISLWIGQVDSRRSFPHTRSGRALTTHSMYPFCFVDFYWHRLKTNQEISPSFSHYLTWENLGSPREEESPVWPETTSWRINEVRERGQGSEGRAAVWGGTWSPRETIGWGHTDQKLKNIMFSHYNVKLSSCFVKITHLYVIIFTLFWDNCSC